MLSRLSHQSHHSAAVSVASAAASRTSPRPFQSISSWYGALGRGGPISAGTSLCHLKFITSHSLQQQQRFYRPKGKKNQKTSTASVRVVKRGKGGKRSSSSKKGTGDGDEVAEPSMSATTTSSDNVIADLTKASLAASQAAADAHRTLLELNMALEKARSFFEACHTQMPTAVNRASSKPLDSVPGHIVVTTENQQQANDSIASVSSPSSSSSDAKTTGIKTSTTTTAVSSTAASSSLAQHPDWVPPLPLLTNAQAGLPEPLASISPAASAFAFRQAPTNGRSHRPFSSEHRRVIERCSFSLLGRSPLDARWVTSTFAVSALAAFLTKHYLGVDGTTADGKKTSAIKINQQTTGVIEEARQHAMTIVARAPAKVALPNAPFLVTSTGAIASSSPSSSQGIASRFAGSASPSSSSPILVSLAGLSFADVVRTSLTNLTLPTVKDFLLQIYDEQRQPRCGLTGTFFESERLVDLLMDAAEGERANGVVPSPYWLASTHPQIEGGYLKLLPTARPLEVSYTSVVYPAHRLLTRGGNEAGIIHSTYLKQRGGDGVAGMNVFTGQTSSNPFFHSQADNGPFNAGTSGWFTLEQALSRGCSVKPATPKDKEIYRALVETRRTTSHHQNQKGIGSAANAGTAVGKTEKGEGDGLNLDDPLTLDCGLVMTLKDHTLYNGCGLERPGRLGRTRTEGEIPVGEDGIWDPHLDHDGRLFRSI